MQTPDGNNSDEIDNLIKTINNLLLKYPDPIEFVSQINLLFNDRKITGLERLNYIFSIGVYLYGVFKYKSAIKIFEFCISLITPDTNDYNLLDIKKILWDILV